LSYNILKNRIQGYEVDMKKGTIYDKKQDRWWIYFKPEMTDYIRNEKANKYKIFITDPLYRRYHDTLEQKRILESVHRLDTSRCQ